MNPITKKEALLDNIAGGENQVEPRTRLETFLAAIANGDPVPEPRTREEYFLAKIAENGGGGGGSDNYDYVDGVSDGTGITFNKIRESEGEFFAVAVNPPTSGNSVFAVACIGEFLYAVGPGTLTDSVNATILGAGVMLISGPNVSFAQGNWRLYFRGQRDRDEEPK